MLIMSTAVNLASLYRAIQQYAFETLANSLMYHLENELSLDIKIIMNNNNFYNKEILAFQTF